MSYQITIRYADGRLDVAALPSRPLLLQAATEAGVDEDGLAVLRQVRVADLPAYRAVLLQIARTLRDGGASRGRIEHAVRVLSWAIESGGVERVTLV